MPRTLADIDSDLATTRRDFDIRWRALSRERGGAIVARDKDILAAFDAGESAKATAARLELTLNTVYGVLDRNERWSTDRRTPITHLPAEQQREYAKLVSNGMPARSARAIAQAAPQPQAADRVAFQSAATVTDGNPQVPSVTTPFVSPHHHTPHAAKIAHGPRQYNGSAAR